MAGTQSEDIINRINQHFFFKEFTFSNNEFVDSNSKQKLEVADHIVWLDYMLFIVQIKERNTGETGSIEKWFENKVLNKAVKQVKSTHGYLDQFTDITIENNKGHRRNLAEAKESDRMNLIIYSPGEGFPEKLRQRKFYESSQIGLIHLFHVEDYNWICKYLITPAEIAEYLVFRERLHEKHGATIVNLPEQYVLGHFLETDNTDKLEARLIKNLSKVNLSSHEFDMSFLIEKFNDKLLRANHPTEYYSIIQEIALLNRSALTHFKIRFERTYEMVNENKDVDPYRIYIPRTDCAFVFIPLVADRTKHWEGVLRGFTYAQKYDMKARRAVGVTMFRGEDPEIIEMYWCYLESEHEFDPKMERMLKEANPFRGVSTHKLDNRYGL